MNARNQFKRVSIKGENFLYPLPIIKGHKYLLKIEAHWAEFLILCLEKRLIDSPDSQSDLYKQSGIHVDGKTPLLEINPHNFLNTLLREKELHSLILMLNNSENPLKEFQKLMKS